MLKRYLSFVVFMLCAAGSIIDDSRAAVYMAKGELSDHMLTLPFGIFFTVMVFIIVFYPVKNQESPA
ncbi:hypothetical protein VA7868_03069 [Vibrio aerogenes CECT 7868]|uniref:Uncharacterized protein n=1 Tax=Vibrio aerogenes CECT 7868 TaxID=1216006 RepID=A0A1M5ZQM2_9VIBR|nr:hypothetical protein [Vibrio aerogenes]SHI26501.1 hypothetical protein VA7868_03069 [Vibrio aerogenes CECT 7868]